MKLSSSDQETFLINKPKNIEPKTNSIIYMIDSRERNINLYPNNPTIFFSILLFILRFIYN